jgi:hypothetical protein
MQIIELPPTRLDLPNGGEPVYIATQQWVLKPWEGEDQPGLRRSWSIKPKFSVSGSRSCAELAVLHHLRDGGWQGIWVNAYNPPATGVRMAPRVRSQDHEPDRRTDMGR